MPPPALTPQSPNPIGPAPSSPGQRRPTRRASLVNAKLSGLADTFMERGWLSLAALRGSTNSGNLIMLRDEAHTLKGATGFVQAHRVRAVCVALQMQCDNALQMLTQKGLEKSEIEAAHLAPAFWDDAREHLARLEKELAGYERSVQMAHTPKEAPKITQNKFTYDLGPEGHYLTEAEHEKKLNSWNKEVYEARVAKAFVEERLVRALYQQQKQLRTTRIHQQHQEVVQRHQQHRQHGFPTPYTRRQQIDATTENVLTKAMEHSTPRFRDIEDLSPRLASDAMARRGMSLSASSVAQPASMQELSRSMELPPIYSLMNPRNQMTSPLPDKETLLPPSPRKERKKHERKTRSLSLPTLLKFVAICFEEKRKMEAAVQKESGARIGVDLPQASQRVPLLRVINDTLHREHGSSVICAEKFQQLRVSCSKEGHGEHPRIAVFRRMAGWDAPEREMGSTQEMACVQLLSWLGIATNDPPDKDARMVLRLKDVPKVLDHLLRVRFVPSHARPFLLDLANDLRLPRSELPRATDTPMVDADVLLWRWMEQWGGWDCEIDEEAVRAAQGLTGRGALSEVPVAGG